MGLARAYSRLGKPEKAIEAQMNAISAARQANRDPELIQRLTEELAAYRRLPELRCASVRPSSMKPHRRPQSWPMVSVLKLPMAFLQAPLDPG